MLGVPCLLSPFAHTNKYFKVEGVRIESSTIEMSGGVGAPPRPPEGGFGDVGEGSVCYQRLTKATQCLGKMRDSVEADSINVEKYYKELVVSRRLPARHHGAQSDHELQNRQWR